MTHSESILFAQERAKESARIPYTHHVDSTTISTKDKSFLTFFELKGLDKTLMTTEEIDAALADRATFLKSIADEKVRLYTYVDRSKVELTLGENETTQEKSRNIIYRGYNQEGLFTTRTFIVVEVSILTRAQKQTAGFFNFLGLRNASPGYKAKIGKAKELASEISRKFLTYFEKYGIKQLGTYKTNGTSYSNPLALLHRILNGDWQSVAIAPMDISGYLSDCRKRFSHGVVELRSHSPKLVKLISIKSFPKTTDQELLDKLYHVPGNILVAQGFEFLPSHIILPRIKTQIRHMHQAGDESDTQISELEDAKDGVQRGDVFFGNHYLTIAVYAESTTELNKTTEEVSRALVEKGLISVTEDIGAELAYWSLLPGNLSYAPRLRPITHHNFSCALPLIGSSVGLKRSKYWDESVFKFPTENRSIYNFNWHEGMTDRGHTIVAGPNGSGKTFVAALLLHQTSRFGSKVIIFDKDRSNEVFIKSVRGVYKRIVPGMKTGWNPFALPDTAANRNFLVMWFSALSSKDQPLSVENIQEIETKVKLIYDDKLNGRPLSQLIDLFGSPDASGSIANRLKTYVGTGMNAWLFDNESTEDLFSSKFVGIDLSHVLQMDRSVREAVGLYLLYQVNAMADAGIPLIVYWEELWKYLDVEGVFQDNIKDLLKVIRKKMGIIVGSTQDPSDAADTKIASTLRNEFATAILFANRKAVKSHYQTLFAVSDDEFNFVKNGVTEDRKMLISKAGESSVVSFGMPKIATSLLSIYSANMETINHIEKSRIPSDRLFDTISTGEV